MVSFLKGRVLPFKGPAVLFVFVPFSVVVYCYLLLIFTYLYTYLTCLLLPPQG